MMKPKELKETLAQVGWNQRELANLLDVNERTMRRYCSGDLPIPLTVSMAIELLVDHLPEWPCNK